MKIQFTDEDLVDRTSLHIEPDTPFTSFLTHIQDGIEAEGIRVDRKFRYVKGKLCKFSIELITEANSELLQKRKKLVETIQLNLNKIKWEVRDNMYILHIGKIGEKDIYVTVAKFFSEISEEDKQVITEITKKVTDTTLNITKKETPTVTYNAPKYTPPPPKQIQMPPQKMAPQRHISNTPAPQIPQPTNTTTYHGAVAPIKQKYLRYTPLKPTVEVKHCILNFKVKE